ncbi:MAG: hypothetical protein IT161_10875 [Bryobacterales bacterium]|nr:hypothetical protein [Bryobacterales bacterium]
MHKLLPLTVFAASLLFGQYKTAPAGPPPSDLSPSVQALLVKDGVKVLKADGSVLCEVWMRAAEPAGGSKEENSTFTAFPHGALIGAIRFPARHYDRRGQTIKPGVYTMRHSLFPLNGDHLGVAPQRDFLVLSLPTDTDGAATPAFDPLMEMSRKASGTPHPLVLSYWKSDAGAKPGFEPMGDQDVVLTIKVGSTPVSIILIGKAEG